MRSLLKIGAVLCLLLLGGLTSGRAIHDLLHEGCSHGHADAEKTCDFAKLLVTPLLATPTIQFVATWTSVQLNAPTICTTPAFMRHFRLSPRAPPSRLA
ncbi:MAG: hypothetical protein ACR2IE_05410 [Candidatus Sumerlaeaceae bacterium]